MGLPKGSVCASDAFFPFNDSVESLASHGVRAIIQPEVQNETKIALMLAMAMTWPC